MGAPDHAAYFDRTHVYQLSLLAELDREDGTLVLDRAKARYLAMAPDLAYAADYDHPMADSLRSCATLLAIFLELEADGVDVHRFGSALLVNMRRAIDRAGRRPPDPDDEGRRLDMLIDAGKASQKEAGDGEFVFDARRDGDGWRMDIHSCGICALFSRFDAMDLVPYMCATDDLMSDLNGSGLTRTGTIALGRDHCDFHFMPGGSGNSVAELYPDRIRVVEAGS
jgi:hypothetical protein